MGRIQKAIAAIYAEKKKMGKIRQEDLAKALGCSQSAVSHILNGSRMLSEKWIESLCEHLEITLADIDKEQHHLFDTKELRESIEKLRDLYKTRPEVAFRNIERSINEWLQALQPRHELLDANLIEGSFASPPEADRVEESGINYLDSDAPRPVNLVSVPHYNAVPAGDPRDMSPENHDRMNIVHSEAKDTWYTLRVWGDSMSPDLMDGDIVLMDSAPEPKNGDIVAALIDGSDSTLKVFSRTGDEITLTPIESEHHSPRTFHASRVVIQGVLVQIVRRYVQPRPIGAQKNPQ